jgi:hypothetical protein
LSTPLRSLKYTLQHNYIAGEGLLSNLLLSFAGSQTVASSGSLYWDLVSVGDPLPTLKEQITDAWNLANIDGIKRSLSFVESNQKQTVISDWNISLKSLHQQILIFKRQYQEINEDLKNTQETDINELNHIKHTINESVITEDEVEVLGANLDTNEFSLDTLSELIDDTQSHSNSKKANLIIVINEIQSLYVPKEEDIKHYDSITVLVTQMNAEVLVWKRWAARVGARLLTSHENLITELSDVIQSTSYTIPRQNLELVPAPGFVFQSITVLSPQASPLQIESKERVPINLTLAPTLSKQRSSCLLTIQELSSSALKENRLACTCIINDKRYEIFTSALDHSNLEQHHLAVSFAHQLSHRARCLDGLLYTYSRKELRRVVQYLDQWLKLSIAMETKEISEEIYQLKIKFLSVGSFSKMELHHLIRSGLKAPFMLNEAGEWIESYKLS